MSADGLEELLRVAARVHSGETLTAELMAEEKVPARLRLLIAAAVLVAADRSPSKKAIIDTAPAGWSATNRNHGAFVEEVQQLLPALVNAQLNARQGAVTSADLRAQLHDAHASVQRERTRRQELEDELRHVRQYALELHRRLQPEYDAMMRERAQKVRTLRPVVDPEPLLPPSEAADEGGAGEHGDDPADDRV
ncbi:hypothetical protein N864_02845 [Intrasporangium chromatireducens Q5-1]|uniref:Uncharacterized protein n=1 Tax=Intrasporangium chromatireducens Q5-1 TaxID=584657 RepID=W9GKS1_9MICO|nr:hypothetical protein [Intrasporangium chromatireducens]EWT05717.1 hypothetical protein N864_02845 [Intrasporangium chromatireducens Q5-1]